MTRRYDDLDDPEDDTANVAARQAAARRIARGEMPTDPETAKRHIADIRRLLRPDPENDAA